MGLGSLTPPSGPPVPLDCDGAAPLSRDGCATPVGEVWAAAAAVREA